MVVYDEEESNEKTKPTIQKTLNFFIQNTKFVLSSILFILCKKIQQ